MFKFQRKKKPDQAAAPAPCPTPVSNLKQSLLSLEQRLMFDAAAAATAAEVASEQVAQDQAEAAVSAEPSADSTTAEQADSQELLQAIASYTPGESTTEVAFVDPTVPDYQELLAGMDPNVEVIMLDAGKDGVQQIAESLAGRSGIDAIHLISHGNSGELQLGVGTLDTESMSGKYANELSTIQQSLSEQADILVYGCDFAEGEAGQVAVNLLAEMTGADVHASTDETGHVSLGGDWEFEVSTGTIETSLAISDDAQMNWAGILGTETVSDTFSADSYSNNNGTQSWSTSWSETDAGGGGASGGDIRVNSSQLRIDTDTVGNAISRGVNLSGATSATLTFDYTNALLGADRIEVRVSTDGGANYSTLGGGIFSIAANTGSGAASLDLSGYMSANTRIQFIVTGTGGGERLYVDNVQISYQTNAAPTITNLSGDSLSYTEGDGAVVIEQSGNALVADVDSSNLDTGTLTVSIPSGSDSAEDVLSIRNQGTGAGQIGVSGANVTYQGVTIGTFTGGSGGSNLVITLNSSATPTAVTALVKNITYENTDTAAPTTGARTVRYALTDGDGGTSANYDTTVTVSNVTIFQQGTSGYSGTEDTELSSTAPSSDYGANVSIDIDFDVANENEALIRFGNIFGTGPGQIPVGSTIVSASLRLYASGGTLNTISAHQMLVNWSEASTWDSLTNGVQTNGAEAEVTADGTYVGTGSTGYITITGLEQSVQAWSDGASNYGWVLQNSGTDGVQFASSEAATLAQRPQLIVAYIPSVAPTITNLSGDSLAYSEGDGAVVIEQGANALVADVDSTDFNTGTLTVSIPSGGDSAEDVLAIRNQGTGAGQIGVNGSTITYGGTTIGTFTGGSSGSNLVITLNSNATPTAVTALVKNITYQNTDTNAPTTGARTVRYVLTDGDGGTSANYDTTVTVSGVNDAPTITNLGGDSLAYAEGDGAVVIEQSANALVADVDSTDFNTGTLTVSIPSGGDSAEDVLSIRNQGTGAGQIGVSGANVTYGGVTIGTFTGGSSGSNLVITLNSNATPAAVTALVQNITYENTDTNAPTAGARTVRYVLTDGDGGASANYDTTVTVGAANDAPTFGVGDGQALTSFGSGWEFGKETVIQPDGKILVGGYSDSGGSDDFSLVRYNADGTLDTSFGGGDGVAFAGIVGRAEAMVLQADGKVVLSGYTTTGGYQVCLVRFNADGTLDTSFGGGDGIASSGVSGDAKDVVLQTDGKFLVAADLSNSNFNLMRFNSDGSLDTSFGGGSGYVSTDLAGGNDRADSLTIQSDGKVLLSGFGFNGTSFDFALVRYNTDGSLDTSFNGTGKVLTDFGANSSDMGNEVRMQADGKIVVAGWSDAGGTNDFAIARYNTNGTLDTGFGTSGKVTINLGGNDLAEGLTIQSDGKILVTGTAGINGGDVGLLRLNTNGTLDTTFGGGDGIVTTDYSGASDDRGYSVAVQSDGQIVVSGTTQVGVGGYNVALNRYSSTGSLDTTLDPVNTLNGTPAYSEGGSPVVLDADVQIFDAELSALNNFSGATLTLVRNGGANAEDVFSATGTLSLSSGNVIVSGTTIGTYTNSGGTLAFTFIGNATQSLVNSAMQQIAYSNSSDAPPATAQINWTFSDGNSGAQGTGGALQATGSTTVTITAVNDAPTITNLSSDSLSYSEGDGAVVIEQGANALVSDVDSANLDTGTLTVSIPVGGDSAEDVLSIRNQGTGAGQIGVSGANVTYQGVTIGTFTGGSGGSALVITLNSNATPTAVTALIKTITYENTDTASPTTGARTVRYVLTDGDGGTSANYDTTVTVSGGTNDAPTFSVGDGIVTTSISAGNDEGRSVTIQPDGKILVAGLSSTGVFALTRYNTDGSLDASFGGGDGIVTTAAGGFSEGYSVTLQADGKILVGGRSASATWDFALVRYNSDGSLDTSFGGGDGTVITAIGPAHDSATGVTVQADGKILLVGTSDSGSSNDVALVRYNSDGTLDTGFGGGDGMVTTDYGPGSDDAGNSVSVLPDGKILVGGYVSTPGTILDFALFRYNADGTLDTSFGSGTGIARVSVAGILSDQGYSVTVQADGKILLGGLSVGSSNDFALVRFNADGTLDTSFGGGDGQVTTPIGAGLDYGQSLTVQADGKIVLAGYSHNGSNYDVALVRYNSDGTMDTSFGGGDGMVTTAIGSGDDRGYSVAVQADGKIVVAGTSHNGSSNDFALLRYNSDGTLDTQFDTALTNSLNGTPTYIEGGSPVVLDADVQIFDAELSALDNFEGATLTLARNGGANAEDQLVFDGIVVTTSGANVLVSGVQVGTYSFTGGEMTIAFNGNATQALVNSLMQHILYYNVSDTPPASAQIDWTFNDGNTGSQGTGGALQATGSTTVTITATNDAPVVTPVAPDVTFVEGGLPQVIDATGTIVDVDSANFDGGVLTVSISANGTADDRLIVGNWGTGPGQVGVSGSNVTYEGTVIGTVSGGTSGSDPLVITFNPSATPSTVQEVYRSIQFNNVSENPSTATRTLTIGLTDGDGGTATPQTKLVYVQGTNDAPVNTVPGAQTVAEDTPLALSGVSVNDVDGNLSTVQLAVGNGMLTVTLSGGATISAGSNGTNSLTLSGSQTDINATLASLTYQGTADFNDSDTLTITSTDSNAVSDVDTVAITVTAGNDAPSDLALSANTVAENAANGTVVGAASTTDVDAGDSHTYQLMSNAGGRFAIDTTTGVITVADGTLLDYEAATSHTVTIRTTDAGGLIHDQILTIGVTDVAEGTTPPTVVPGPLVPGPTPTPLPPSPPPPSGPPTPGPTEGGTPTPVPGPVVPPLSVARTFSPPFAPRVLQAPATGSGLGHPTDEARPVGPQDDRGAVAWTVVEPVLNLLHEAADQLRTLAQSPEIPVKLSEFIVKELDAMTDSLEEAMQGQQDDETLVAATAAGVSIVLSTGYVVWALRGGWLLASLLATMPAWRSFDPLPVLVRAKEDRERDGARDDRGAARREDKRIEHLFGSNEGKAA